MISALDSSVILDVLGGKGDFSESSMQVVRKVRREGKLIVCECVIAEIYPAFSDQKEVLEFLMDWQIDYLPLSRESALLAGNRFSAYLQRGGTQKRVLPDFLIGAHAEIQADRLIARDRGYLRDYFTDLVLLDPSVGSASQ
jgi:predicted nucleic acid-binding protein